MPRNYYLIAGIVYFCSNLIILFASIFESTTQYKLAYPYPPGYTPVVLAKPPCALDLEYFHPHHLDLPPAMKEIPTAPPLPNAPPTQDFSKLGFVYITRLLCTWPSRPSLPPLWESGWTLVWAVTTLEKIFELDPLAHIQSAVRYNHQCPQIFSAPKLFRGKFNYLPAYNLRMEPPVAPKPMPASSPDIPTDHTGKLFGIVYINLTGVIDTIIPAAGLWSWVGKSFSYLFELAPLLWWALPAKKPGQN
ncbi:hypothetical protein DSO57_1014124 [Entomophthora muscae]|uniref:Uncharacterized protein n=1 Tax=Entomophthora muscae TaxID=34485 RepID=A0ACC2RKA6_9FUNG|nr:hypothetical protein DSO57_1014124 [Entomophthora muscae]